MFVLLGFTMWSSSGGYRRTEGARRACIAMQQSIRAAASQWAFDRQIPDTNAYSLSTPELLSYFKGSRLPVCPLGGTYTRGATIADLPTCSIESHRREAQ